MVSSAVWAVLMLETLMSQQTYILACAAVLLFALSFFRSHIFVRVAEAGIHLGLVFWFFFKGLPVGSWPLLWLIVFSLVIFLLVKLTLPLIGILYLSVLILFLSRTLPSIPMSDFAIWLGSTGPAIVASTGLLLPIALPGLSYLAFKWVRAVIDYQRMTPKPSILTFLSYCFYYPTFFSGPIASLQDFQLSTNNTWYRSGNVYLVSLARILWGYAKYAPLASVFYQLTFSRNLSEMTSLHWSQAIVSCFAYLAYLFLNFSGFSDIVIGVSGLLGHRITENFNRPYLAVSVRDFWQRWHISLTALLKESLFKPFLEFLERRKIAFSSLSYVVGSLIVFLSMGFWHGSSWSFFVFVSFHWVAVSLEFYLRPKIVLTNWIAIASMRTLMWFYIAISFFFFENSPESANKVLKLLFTGLD